MRINPYNLFSKLTKNKFYFNELKYLDISKNSAIYVIPKLNIFTFKDNYCCGAGAQNLIHNSENSLNIIKPKIEFIQSNNIDLILTYNIGCSLNFINSININNMKQVEVKHPITFINERMM